MEFKKFDFEKNMPDRAPAILVDGVSGSGKTYMIEKILPKLNKKYNFKKIIVISSTSDLSGNFGMIKKSNHYKPDKMDLVLNNLVTLQRENIKKKNRNNVLVIMDDVIGTTGGNLRYNKILEKGFTSFRHLNIGLILLLQDIGGKTPPSIRLNATQIIMFKNNNYNKKRYIVENFLSVDNNKKKGYEILNNIWNEAFKAIVINQYDIQKSNDLDYVYYYKA